MNVPNNLQQKPVSDKPQDFILSKFQTYTGPSYYLNRQALVFNIYLDEISTDVSHYKEEINSIFPDLNVELPARVIDIFGEVLLKVMKMDMNLYINNVAVQSDGDEWTVAIEYLEKYVAEDAVFAVRDWFLSMTYDTFDFDFKTAFVELQDAFNKTMFGGPTLYSLIEGGLKRNIAVQHLFEENQFQWGYGKKQIRGRSTVFHTDGIKDTEFTTYKDMVGEYLASCGFPTPKGVNCFSEEEIIAEIEVLGFPVVIKPVAGHKGQGVTTGIASIVEAKKAFNNIVKSAVEVGVAFEGALVQQQIYGHDHRLLTVGGKYAAALKRIPAYVIGDGSRTIKELIAIENDKIVRIDNARSPLAKILLDEDMNDFLTLQNLTPESVPASGQEIVLRRVANISAGGVSINVTNEIHPKNIEMVENIAKFFNVTCMGIDVLAKDISKPWDEGNFGIIEINAGPGVFMHLAPAEGGTVDIPGKIMNYHFGELPGFDRVPIIAGNNISENLAAKIHAELKTHKKDVEFGCLLESGVHFNGVYFNNNPCHDVNCQVILRNPKLDFAVFNHNRDNIHDYGMWHQGLDLAVINRANYAENTIKRDLLPGGLVVEIIEKEIYDTDSKVGASTNTPEDKIAGIGAEDSKLISQLKQEISDLKKELQHTKDVENCIAIDIITEMIVSLDGKELMRTKLTKTDNEDELIFKAIQPYLKDLLFKYDYYTGTKNADYLDMDNRYVRELMKK